MKPKKLRSAWRIFCVVFQAESWADSHPAQTSRLLPTKDVEADCDEAIRRCAMGGLIDWAPYRPRTRATITYLTVSR